MYGFDTNLLEEKREKRNFKNEKKEHVKKHADLIINNYTSTCRHVCPDLHRRKNPLSSTLSCGTTTTISNIKAIILFLITRT
jgi:hypothetical protein